MRHAALMPNPSLKPSPNGGPRGPGCRYAVHFRQPGPRLHRNTIVADPTARAMRSAATTVSCQSSAARERGGWPHRDSSEVQLGRAWLPRRQRGRIDAPPYSQTEHLGSNVRALRGSPSNRAAAPVLAVHAGNALAERKAPSGTRIATLKNPSLSR